MNQRERVERAVERDDKSSIVDVILAACNLEDTLYASSCTNRCGGDELFKLRKALEGIFGHDIPTEEDV